MKKYFLICFLTLLTQMVLPQAITVKGTVTDATDGSVLPGVNILVKGTTTGSVTSLEGNYTINVENNAVLIFSYVGYVSQEIAVENRTTINVALEPDIMALEEVVAIGYGTTRKEDATGSVIAISTDDFNKGGINSGTQLIAGKLAGVQITSGGGAPGGGVTIRIRGGSSMQASNDPLFVVDGVPLDNRSISGLPSNLNSINPNDIETITVLKDASATAIYGSRASNGVIIITTKRGKLDRPLTVTYDGFVSVARRTGQVDNLSADEFRDLIHERYPDSTDLAPKYLGTANTDWQDEIFRTAIAHDHVLSLSGGLKNLPAQGSLPYRVSIGYHNEDGILLTSNNKRATGTVKLNPSFLDDHLKADINVKGSYNNNQFADWGAVGAAAAFDPTQTVRDTSSRFGGYFYWRQKNPAKDPITIATRNPVAMLEMRDDNAIVTTLSANGQFDYQMHFLPELTARLNLGYAGTSSDGNVFVPDSAAWSYDPSPIRIGGEKRAYTQKTLNELLDFYFIYKKDLSAISSRLDVTAGYSWQHFYREGTTYATNAFVLDADEIVREDTDYKTENYLVSFFGRLNYILLDRYMLTFTLRQDGSSRFSKDNRWGTFPSVALAWDIADEVFMPDMLNTLKLRLGFGITGQQDITDNDYPYLPAYTAGEPTAAYQFGDYFVNTFRPEGYDINIKWEETTTSNIGLDYGFMENRIYGQIDLYNRETKDLINKIPVPAGTNLSNQITTNVGTLVNKGVEFTVNGTIISRVDLEWEVGWNMTYNQNEIMKLTKVDDPTYLGVPTGSFISGGVGNQVKIHSVGYPASSFFLYKQVYNTDGFPIEGLFVDKNGDGTITIDDKYHFMKPAPDYILGFSTYLRYKDFDFSMTARANIGNYVYNNQYSSNGTYSSLYNSVGYLSNVTRSLMETRFENPKYFSDFYLENGSFLRFDYATAGYNFREVIPFVPNLRVFAAVQNLALITKYKGLDPEVFDGIDNNIFPRPRTITFGVNVQF